MVPTTAIRLRGGRAMRSHSTEGLLRISEPVLQPHSAWSRSRRSLTILVLGVGSFAVTQAGIVPAQGASRPDLTPTPITVSGTNHPGSGPPLQIGSTIHFDSGIANLGDVGTGVFNIRWLVDGQNVNPPAYG